MSASCFWEQECFQFLFKCRVIKESDHEAQLAASSKLVVCFLNFIQLAVSEYNRNFIMTLVLSQDTNWSLESLDFVIPTEDIMPRKLKY